MLIPTEFYFSGIGSYSNANYLLAFDCEEAYKLLLKTNLNSETIDFAFVDISLPPFEERIFYQAVIWH
jgi:hypothetical protein